MRVKLGDVARESRETISGNKHGLPIIGLDNLASNKITLTEWSIDTENTFTKLFRKGQILFGRRRAYLKKAAVAPFDGVCSGDITVIEAIPEKIIPELLPFVIQNDNFFNFAIEKSAGSLSPRVKWENLCKFEFNLPPYMEQRKLSDLLWAINSTRVAYNKLLVLTEEIVKSRFVGVMNQSGISKNEYVELGSVCIRSPQNGVYKKLSENHPVNAKIAKMKQLFTDNAISQEDGLDGIFLTDKEMNTFRLTNADLVFGRRSLVEEGAGKCSLVGDIGDDVVFESSLLRITLNIEKALPIWLYSWFCSDEGKEKMKQIRNVVTIAGIKGSDLKKMRVPVVDINLQNRFAAFVRQADKSKFVVQQQTKNTSLLYNILNGG